VEIPCIFPADQGIRRGEQFAADCLIRHSVSDVEHSPLQCAKIARVRRFTMSSRPATER
jgi:hypothetical protein